MVVPFGLSTHLSFAFFVLAVLSSSAWFSGSDGAKRGLYAALDSAVMPPVLLFFHPASFMLAEFIVDGYSKHVCWAFSWSFFLFFQAEQG